MSLVEFQTGLGRLLREQKSSDPLHDLNLDPNEQKYFGALPQTPGFRFCASIQRSWCIGRAARSAYFTLSLLPNEEREALLNEWVDMGAGTSSFFDAEGEEFLGFISKRLTDPSHELSVCQFEQATLRASNGASTFSNGPGKPRRPSAQGKTRQARGVGEVVCGPKPNCRVAQNSQAAAALIVRTHRLDVQPWAGGALSRTISRGISRMGRAGSTRANRRTTSQQRLATNPRRTTQAGHYRIHRLSTEQPHKPKKSHIMVASDNTYYVRRGFAS